MKQMALFALLINVIGAVFIGYFTVSYLVEKRDKRETQFTKE